MLVVHAKIDGDNRDEPGFDTWWDDVPPVESVAVEREPDPAHVAALTIGAAPGISSEDARKRRKLLEKRFRLG